MVVGFVLRTLNILSQSYWLDDYLALIPVKLSWQDMYSVLLLGGGDTHSPLFSTLLKLWIELFGDHKIIVRLFTVLLGTSLIYLTYILALKLTDKKIALISCSITALSPLTIYYSHEIRSYMLMMVMSASSYYFYFNVITDSSNRSHIGWICSTVMGFYAHILFAVILIPQITYSLLYLCKRRKNILKVKNKLILGLSLIGIAFIPWVAFVYFSILPNFEGKYVFRNTFDFSAILYVIFSLCYGYTLGPSIQELHVASITKVLNEHGLVLIISAICAAFILTGGILQLHKKGKEGLYILLSSGLTIAVVFLLSFKTIIYIRTRFLLMVLPMFHIILGSGVYYISKKKWLSVIVIVFAALNIIGIYNYNYQIKYYREDYENIVNFVNKKCAENNSIIFVGGHQLTILKMLIKSDNIKTISKNNFSILGCEETAVVVWNRVWNIDDQKEVSNIISNEFTILDEKEFVGFNIQTIQKNCE